MPEVSKLIELADEEIERAKKANARKAARTARLDPKRLAAAIAAAKKEAAK